MSNREPRSKSMKSEETSHPTEHREELPPIIRTNTIRSHARGRIRNTSTSVKNTNNNYSESTKRIMQIDLESVRSIAQSIENEAASIHTPMNKYKDPAQDGEKLLTNIRPVLKKEFPLIQLDLSKLNNKYKAKDFHIMDPKTTRHSSKSISIRTGPTSTRSSVQPISIIEADLATLMNRNESLKAINMSPEAQVVDFGALNKKKSSAEKPNKIYITERVDSSTERVEKPTATECNTIENRDIDEIITTRRRQKAEKSSWSPRKAMELAKFKGTSIPKNLLPLLVRRKKLLKDVNKGGKHWEDIMKMPLEKPKKDEKFYLKYTPLSEYFKPSKTFEQNQEILTSRSRKKFWEVGY